MMTVLLPLGFTSAYENKHLVLLEVFLFGLHLGGAAAARLQSRGSSGGRRDTRSSARRGLFSLLRVRARRPY